MSFNKTIRKTETNKKRTTLRNSLFKHCTQKDTGIVFITTDNNKACRIFVTEGKVDAIVMGRLTTEEAVSELIKVSLKGSSFSDKFNLPFAKTAVIKSSTSLLKQFGYVFRSKERPANEDFQQIQA